MIEPEDVIKPNWPAPSNVTALSTTRVGGASERGYAHNNLALHVGDNPEHVEHNRRQLIGRAGLPSEPQWLEQVHGVKVVHASSDRTVQTADACVTQRSGLPCAVLTADCLPILLCDRQGTQVAAVHAGWRSLAAGIIRRTLDTFEAPSDQLMAWMGPAIGPARFEVGVDVLEAFFANALDAHHTDAMATAFTPGQKPMRFLCNLYALAEMELNGLGVSQVFGGGYCTYEQADRFYSYRRDGRETGRMASLIWLS